MEEAYTEWAKHGEGPIADGDGRVIQSEAGRAAFYAGWKAREKAPNTLIIDPTGANMQQAPYINCAAVGVPVHVARAKQCVPIKLGGESDSAQPRPASPAPHHRQRERQEDDAGEGQWPEEPRP
jgi:hypothetical protein